MTNPRPQEPAGREKAKDFEATVRCAANYIDVEGDDTPEVRGMAEGLRTLQSLLTELRSAVKGCGDCKRHDTACGAGVPDPVTGMRPVCWDCGDAINRVVVLLASIS